MGKDQSVRLEVKERPDVGVYVKDLSVFMVNNADDMDKLMTVGNRNRSIGATNMNAVSSRSHAIFSITVECSEKGADGRQHVRYGMRPFGGIIHQKQLFSNLHPFHFSIFMLPYVTPITIHK